MLNLLYQVFLPPGSRVAVWERAQLCAGAVFRVGDTPSARRSDSRFILECLRSITQVILSMTRAGGNPLDPTADNP